MRVIQEPGKWRLEAEDPAEVEVLSRAQVRQELRVTGRRKASVELTWGRRADAEWVAVARTVITTWTQAGPDWLMAVGLVLATWAAVAWTWTTTPPRMALGLGLLVMVTGAILAGAVSSLGVRPSKVSRRWWRWAYWVAGVWLAILGGAVTVGVTLWLAWALAGVAQRVMP